MILGSVTSFVDHLFGQLRGAPPVEQAIAVEAFLQPLFLSGAELGVVARLTQFSLDLHRGRKPEMTDDDRALLQDAVAGVSRNTGGVAPYSMASSRLAVIDGVLRNGLLNIHAFRLAATIGQVPWMRCLLDRAERWPNLALEEAADCASIPKLPLRTEFDRAMTDILAPMEIPHGKPPRVLLLGPGPSKTDLLYALRILSRLETQTGVAGELQVYETSEDPLVQKYCTCCAPEGVRMTLNIGPSGNIFRREGEPVHLMLAFHFTWPLGHLYQAASKNLVSGGVILWQKDVSIPLQPDPSLLSDRAVFREWRRQEHAGLARLFQDKFRPISTPFVGPIAMTPIALGSPLVDVFAYQLCKG